MKFIVLFIYLFYFLSLRVSKMMTALRTVLFIYATNNALSIPGPCSVRHFNDGTKTYTAKVSRNII